jgi:hypothetical protein
MTRLRSVRSQPSAAASRMACRVSILRLVAKLRRELLNELLRSLSATFARYAATRSALAEKPEHASRQANGSPESTQQLRKDFSLDAPGMSVPPPPGRMRLAAGPSLWPAALFLPAVGAAVQIPHRTTSAFAVACRCFSMTESRE